MNRIDRSGWLRGPWDQEPDRVVWWNPLPCVIQRNHIGGLCGYVGIHPTHPWFGVTNDDILNVDVHGGLTFSGHLSWSMGQEPELAPFWFLGFDCSHHMDLLPGARENLSGGTYRDLHYVRGEVEKLSQAAVQAGGVTMLTLTEYLPKEDP